MSDSLTALVALDAGVDEEAVREVLGATRGVEVAAVLGSLENSWTALGEHPCDVVILACEPDSEAALWFLREATRRYPERPVIVLSGTSANGFVQHAFESGADDLVMAPENGNGSETAAVAAQLRFAVEKAVARRTGVTSLGAGTPASLICVLGPKGGIGKTLTSANLSVALALAGKKVTVVDLDLQFGDVGLSLGLVPKRTIFDLVKSGGSLDEDKVEAYLTRHSSGARVLMAPVRPDQASAVTIEFLRELYPVLRAANDYVIVDTPPGFSPEVIASIDSSTHVVMIGMLDSLSLKNTKLGLETLELMGYKRDRIRIVLNRADTNVGVTQADVEAIVGRAPDVLISSNRDVVRSVNEGEPIVQSRPRTDVAQSFRTLAELYTGNGAKESRRLRLRRKS
ncbi:MAG TPA: AAA family ATPase [Solirubrobacteraceae bacterium]|nr:AAA family ATPase [Solirubrobacteraceae bacterium]